MLTGNAEVLKLERPWQRTAPKRTPKERLRLVLSVLIGLYLANTTANVLYKRATQWQVDMLQQRIESLARVDPAAPEIARMQEVIGVADYSSLTEPATSAIARRSGVKAYLKRHPHLSLGIALGGEYDGDQIARTLKDLNQRLRPRGITVGLSGAPVTIALPPQSIRDDFLRGMTTVFDSRPDYVVALAAERCQYRGAKAFPGEPKRNRLYSFGWRGLTVVDAAAPGPDLTMRLQTELVEFLTGDAIERRWRADDYAPGSQKTEPDRRIAGLLWRGVPQRKASTGNVRSVSISIGLDRVPPAEARAVLKQINTLYKPLGVSFTIQHLHPHRLPGKWKWPVEMRRMLKRGESDIYVLLSSSEWLAPATGLVRGLANGTVGALMVQTGTPEETTRRLAHELGHLFGLPHTLVPGHVMYPNEAHIGLTWSPGSKRMLLDNKHAAQWYSAIASETPFNVAVNLAPPMRRAAGKGETRQALEATASGDVWVSCGP